MHGQTCPGARIFRQPKPESFPCPGCGSEVEIWTDEFRRPCPRCGRVVFRDAGLGCLEWCAMAEQCLGEQAYGDFMRRKRSTVRERLLAEIAEHFGADRRRIDHAKAVLEHAEEILRAGDAADWHIVVPAAILHDVGIKAAEEKYGSAAPRYQEAEGPPIARRMLLRLDYNRDHVREICNIISHHHSPRRGETPNFQVVHDADSLVNDRRRIMDGEDLGFYTDAAADIARRMQKGKSSAESGVR